MGTEYNKESGTSFSLDVIKQTKLQNAHERDLKKDQHEFDLNCKKMDQQHELDTIDKNLGCVGRTFGSAENASKNIAAILCILLLVGVTIVSIVVYNKEKTVAAVAGLWDGILPIITLSLGYLFGKK